MDQREQADQPLFSARLTPHRSLTQAHVRLLLIVFGFACLVTAIPFIALGAWPVAGFFGLDVALLYVAFRANFRDARAFEQISVTPFELHLAKVTPSGARTDWRFNPLWVRLEKEEDEEFGLQKLAVAVRSAKVEVGSYLGPDEKVEFADHLSRALAEARRGPRFD